MKSIEELKAIVAELDFPDFDKNAGVGEDAWLEQLRNLESEKEITEDEYNYIYDHIDELRPVDNFAEKTYIVNVSNIDYDINEEDVIEYLGHQPTDLELGINLIKKSLPTKMRLIITCLPEDLDDEITCAISDRTGWLVNSADSEVEEKK